MGQVKVLYYIRPAGPHSIERLFATIGQNLPPDVTYDSIVLPGARQGVCGLLINMWAVRRARRSVDYDLHHVTGDVHFIVPMLPRGKTILTLHDLVRLHELRGIKKSIYRLLWFTLPLKFAACVTTISDATHRGLCQEFPWVRDKAVLVENPLPEGPWSRSDGGIRRWPDRPEHLTILHVGVTHNKNLPYSISVTLRLGADLVILGKPDQQQMSLLKSQGIRFRVVSEVPDEEVPDVYRSAHLLLFPSLAEGFGLPILEAQACGLPVITSDCEPMRAVGGDGVLLIDPTRPESAESRIRALFETPHMVEELRNKGVSNVQQYDATSAAAKYAQIYRKLAT